MDSSTPSPSRPAPTTSRRASSSAAGIHAYDEHVQWYRIRVHTGTLRERRGVAILPGDLDGFRLSERGATR